MGTLRQHLRVKWTFFTWEDPVSRSTFELLSENLIPHFAKEIKEIKKDTILSLRPPTNLQTTKQEMATKNVEISRNVPQWLFHIEQSVAQHPRIRKLWLPCQSAKMLICEWTVMGTSLANDIFFGYASQCSCKNLKSCSTGLKKRYFRATQGITQYRWQCPHHCSHKETGMLESFQMICHKLCLMTKL